MRLSTPALICLSAFGLSSCDPVVHIAYRKDFDRSIDPNCVEQGLKTVSAEVRRGSYVSDGYDTREFGKGTKVIQFLYPDPLSPGMSYTLDVAPLRNGQTGYYHGWGTIGTDITPEQQAKVLPLLKRANDAVAKSCGLSFKGSEPREVAG